MACERVACCQAYDPLTCHQGGYYKHQNNRIMKLAVRFIYYDESITPLVHITSLTDDQWHDFKQMTPDQRRDFMIYLLLRGYLEGKVKEMCWISLDNQDRLTVIYPHPTLEEWKQKVRDSIKLINSNLAKEDWEEIEEYLSRCTEKDADCDWEEVAWDMLL